MPPEGRWEERLNAALVHQFCRGWVDRDWTPIPGLAHEVSQEHQRRGYVLVATDGGSKGRGLANTLGSFGIAIADKKVWGGQVHGLDHTSVMAETWALFKTRRASGPTACEILSRRFLQFRVYRSTRLLVYFSFVYLYMFTFPGGGGRNGRSPEPLSAGPMTLVRFGTSMLAYVGSMLAYVGSKLPPDASKMPPDASKLPPDVSKMRPRCLKMA